MPAVPISKGYLAKELVSSGPNIDDSVSPERENWQEEESKVVRCGVGVTFTVVIRVSVKRASNAVDRPQSGSRGNGLP